MKLATSLFLPFLSGLLLTVAVSAHNKDDKKEHCKLKHKHHRHSHSHHHHHHSHHQYHHSHQHNHTTPPTHVSGGSHSLSPGGGKAGVAGQEAAHLLKSVIFWVNDWEPNPEGRLPDELEFVPECYGFNWSGHDEDYKRFEAFKKLPVGKHKHLIGPNEIDFKGGASAGLIPAKDAAKLWEQWIAPWGRSGTILVSPSCAKQRDETWMGPFLEAVTTKPDVINVHLFSDKVEDIEKVIDHYAQYNKPMWITEFACINFRLNHICSQEETNNFIWNAVRIFEADDRIKAYSYADADSNGAACQLSKNGRLTESGKTYKAALEKYGTKNHGGKMRRSTVASIDGAMQMGS